MNAMGALDARAASFVRTFDTRRCSDAVYCDAALFAVADGIDHADGSGRRVLDEVLRLLAQTVDGRDLRAALHAGNWALWYADPTMKRSCATVTIARLERDRLVVGHVGDSRAYLERRGHVRQLTDDHVIVDTGAFSRAARLGTDQAKGQIDLISVQIRAGDKLLLCTDGLWRQFGSRDLAELFAGGFEIAAARLRKLAGGASEDASAVVVEFTPRNYSSSSDDVLGRV